MPPTQSTLNLNSANLCMATFPWSAQNTITGTGYSANKFLLNTLTTIDQSNVSAAARFNLTLAQLYNRFRVIKSDIQLFISNLADFPVLVTLHLSISPILLATLSEISSASNSESFVLSSRGGNRESLTVKRSYNIIDFL
jgi:hypothetical protein